jgi:hypothetical protein
VELTEVDGVVGDRVMGLITAGGEPILDGDKLLGERWT